MFLSAEDAEHVESMLLLAIKGMKRRAAQLESEDDDEQD